MGWRVLTTGAWTHKEKLHLRKKRVFGIEKSIEDAKQKEKNVPDLLEAIMRPTDPVKEELRRNLCKMSNFSSK